MERGTEQEPIARQLYEEETFCTVENGGFFDLGEIGCSPDGLPPNGVIEIKCVIAGVHFKSVKRQDVDPAYKWQCIGNLKFTERDWLDFVSYCSEYPTDQQLFIFRMNKDNYQKEFQMIESRTQEFEALVRQTKKNILNSNYAIWES